jgi:hypothetical protein
LGLPPSAYLAELLEQPASHQLHRARGTNMRRRRPRQPNPSDDAGRLLGALAGSYCSQARFVRDESLRRRLDALPPKRGSTFELPERFEFSEIVRDRQ